VTDFFIKICKKKKIGLMTTDRDWAADVRAQQYWLDETDREAFIHPSCLLLQNRKW
jgi:hypothetical protein